MIYWQKSGTKAYGKVKQARVKTDEPNKSNKDQAEIKSPNIQAGGLNLAGIKGQEQEQESMAGKQCSKGTQEVNWCV